MQKSKLPSGDTGMSPRETEESIKRIEDDLYYSSDNIKIRLTRIEEKLEHVATRDDLKNFATRDDMEKFKATMRGDMEKFKVTMRGDMGRLQSGMERLRSELIAHSNTLFRWSIGVFVSGLGVILTVLKLT